MLLTKSEVSKSIRSADWINTEYNNQSATSTFYTIGSENCPVTCSVSLKYKKPITIQASKVGGTVATPVNFPIDYDVTDPNLAVTGSGGHVQSSNGYDILFYSNSTCASRLPAERETYNSTTGQWTGWVKVPALSTTTNTVIYNCYGGSVPDDPNSDATYGATKVWDSNFVGVWHLPNGTSLSAGDSTSNANNGTSPAATTIITTGQVDGGGSFDRAIVISMLPKQAVTNLMVMLVAVTQFPFG